jgi:hypothetical protein
MTTFEDSISSIGSEGRSPVEFAFTILVERLQALSAAERDTIGMPDGDPAFDAWFSETETARQATVAAAEAVIMAWTQPQSPADLRYRGIALNFESMLHTDDPARYGRIARAMLRESALWFVPGPGLRAQRARALLRSFRGHFEILLALPDYVPDPAEAPRPSTTTAAAFATFDA